MDRFWPMISCAGMQKERGWENVSDWYGGHLKDEGSLLHSVVYPAALELLQPKEGGHYLDIACGEGAFTRLLAKVPRTQIVGFDASASLIKHAQGQAPKKGVRYQVGDAQKFVATINENDFDGASCLMAIQNIKDLEAVFREASKVLKPGGTFVVVTIHPAFRIPRQSSWGFEEERKLMYRRVDLYMSPLDIPILSNPGAGARSEKTWTYHRPLFAYVNALSNAGFVIDGMLELVSDRESKPGPRSRAENRSRMEIPMFVALRAVKR